MKLYRGSKQPLRIPTANERTEWEKLGSLKNKLVAEVGNIVEGYKKFGEENTQRYAELCELVTPKEFFDIEELARTHAGNDGYLTVITVDDKELHQRGKPNEMGYRQKNHNEIAVAKVYSFQGTELHKNEQRWQLRSIKLKREGEQFKLPGMKLR